MYEMELHEGFDAELTRKLNSGLYNFAKITRDTKISRYTLNHVKLHVYVEPYFIVALNDYFKKLGE